MIRWNSSHTMTALSRLISSTYRRFLELEEDFLSTGSFFLRDLREERPLDEYIVMREKMVRTICASSFLRSSLLIEGRGIPPLDSSSSNSNTPSFFWIISPGTPSILYVLLISLESPLSIGRNLQYRAPPRYPFPKNAGTNLSSWRR